MRFVDRLRQRGPGRAPLDRFESRLVWMFGSPRSGSTWLLQLLVHPLLLAGGWERPELGGGRRASPMGGDPQAIPIDEPLIPHHLTPPMFQDQAVSGEFLTVTLNAFRHAEPGYFLCDEYAEVWRPHLRALVLARLEAQASRVAAAYALRDPLVVVKEPNGSVGADFVMSLHPRARLIFLLRDGRDVVDSVLDAQRPGGWLERNWEPPSVDRNHWRLELVRRESLLWLARTRAVQNAYAAHAPELRHLVRYEDLLRDPRHTLEAIDAWLVSPRTAQERADAIAANDFRAMPADSTGPGKPLRAATPGLWRENLSLAEQQIMHEVIGEKLAELGYE